MSLTVHLYVKMDTLFVRLNGELDHHTTKRLRERLITLIDEYSVRNVVLNLRDLDFMDSSGIGVILGRYNQLRKKDGLVIICNVTKTIEKILKISGLQKILTFTKNEEQAKKILGVS